MAASAVDDVADIGWQRLGRKLRWHDKARIVSYHGISHRGGCEVSGRVLANPPTGGPLEDAAWWDNLLSAYQRFASRELANMRVLVEGPSGSVEVTTDSEGYYAATLPSLAPEDGFWQRVSATLTDSAGGDRADHRVLVPAPTADFAIISDIDDTVLETGITSWTTAAKLTFLHNARTRKPLLGVAAFYQALQQPLAKTDSRRPIFYVSSSAWNLFDLLDDFIELNAIPAGPVFLRDLGIDATKFIKSAGHGHKLDRIKALIGQYPTLNFVLIGDAGQHDPMLYARAATEFPGRIAAVYIRDVDPGLESVFDQRADAALAILDELKIPWRRARDSLAMAEHAVDLGLLPVDCLSEIAREVGRDAERPGAAEAALEEAVD